MKKEKRILDEVEKTLNALDQITDLEANPFLYNRIKAQIDENNLSKERKLSLAHILKPVFLFLLISINILTAVYSLSVITESDTNKNSFLEILNQSYSLDQTQDSN